MPIHLPPLGRRQFLKSAAAAAAGVLTLGHRAWAQGAASHRLALLADTHIDADENFISREVKMAENLRRVIAELHALENKPAGVVIDGDCAHTKGLEGDYRVLGRLIEPLRAAYPVHLTMGNHDDRDQFFGVLTKYAASGASGGRPVQSKHVTILKMPGANWFLLDSLQQVNSTPGEIGLPQRQWLAAALDQHQDTPAIIVLHHDPQREPRGKQTRITGLLDTAELFEVITPRRQVKAVVFGHTHDWSVRQEAGIHLINLPPVGYVFNKARPNGWVHAEVKPSGMDLRLHTLDATHAEAGQTVSLPWRA